MSHRLHLSVIYALASRSVYGHATTCTQMTGYSVGNALCGVPDRAIDGGSGRSPIPTDSSPPPAGAQSGECTRGPCSGKISSTGGRFQVGSQPVTKGVRLPSQPHSDTICAIVYDPNPNFAASRLQPSPGIGCLHCSLPGWVESCRCCPCRHRSTSRTKLC